MSRIGKAPVVIPAKVKVSVQGNRVAAEGPKGKLQLTLPRMTTAQVDSGNVQVSRQGETAEARAMHGLARALINNMVRGVTDGFVKKLEIQGVGFKAAVQGKVVNLALGFSHPILYPIPEGIKVTVEENTKVTIEGADKEMVGRVAAEMRSYYPPEPYKGKGVRYVGEKVVRKEGKTVQ
ncbi:MAG TPA: 50S ribosomal protein L6 [Verrucomicrobiota bacterium]|nr:50S ribosomal protein L6 [Verrucomicrobiota bacterium]